MPYFQTGYIWLQIIEPIIYSILQMSLKLLGELIGIKVGITYGEDANINTPFMEFSDNIITNVTQAQAIKWGLNQ